MYCQGQRIFTTQNEQARHSKTANKGSYHGIWDEYGKFRDEQVSIKKTILALGIWTAFVALLFLVQIGLDGMELPENSIKELINTLLFGLVGLGLISGLQQWRKFPSIFETQWYLFHIVLSAFSYLIFESLFVEMMMEPDHSFVIKASSLGSSYIDKVLGNGFSIYVILVALFAWVNRKKPASSQPDSTARVGLEQVKVKLANRTYFVETKDILYIRSAQNYSELFTNEGPHVIRETLRALELSLDQNAFMRIHRSVIINVNEASEFISTPNGNYKLKLHDGTVLNIGNKFKKKVLAHFEV